MWITPQEQAVVGECLEDARRQAQVTQQELALRLGKPQSFVSAYETGQRRVDVLEFLTILRALDIDALPVFVAIRDRFPLPVPWPRR